MIHKSGNKNKITRNKTEDFTSRLPKFPHCLPEIVSPPSSLLSRESKGVSLRDPSKSWNKRWSLFTMHSKLSANKGFTLLETLISLFIVSLIMLVVGSFQADVFKLNAVIQSGLKSQNDARKIIRPMAGEVRSASLSNLGSYPLATVATSTFTFYSDIDNDSLKERVRYFLDGDDFKKGVLKPSGNPLVYNENNEDIIEVVHDVINSDEIFTYYDSSYDGTALSTPLVQPVSPSSVRLVKVELIVDENPSKPPAAILITTQMSMRNLKDNYEN